MAEVRGQTQPPASASVKTKKASEYAGSCRCSAGGRRLPSRSGNVLSSTIFSTLPFSFTDLEGGPESAHEFNPGKVQSNPELF